MPINKDYNELEVIGFGTALPEKCDVPIILTPIFALKNVGSVLVPPYDERVSSVQAEECMSREEFRDLGEQCEVTLLEKPLPADKDSVIYVGIGSGQVEYIALKEAHRRLVEFSDNHRLLGDNHYSAGNLREAAKDYELAAAVSQRAEDYARVLLRDGIPGIRQQRLKRWIKEQGENPDDLIKKVKELLESPEVDRN